MTDMRANKNYAAFILAGFAITTLAIIVFTFYETIRFSYNFGIGRDEATYIIQSTINFLSAKGWGESVLQILSVHVQHVLLGMESSNLLSYWVLGNLNFKFINAFNVLLLCLAGVLMLRSYAASTKHKILLASIIFPLLLSPVHNECMLVAACTGNHYFGLAFSVAALYFFSQPNIRLHFIAAEICSVCAVFSFATGILLPAAGLYLLCKTRSGRQWQLIAAHTVISSIALLIYYWRTQPIALSIPPMSGIKDLLFFALWLGVYTLSLMGSLVVWLMYDHPVVLPIVGLTIALLAAWFYMSNRRDIGQHTFLSCGALLFFCMLLMIALGRYFGSVAPRYAAYNILFLLFTLLLAFRIHDDRCDQRQQSEKKDAKYYFLATAVLLHFMVALYYHLPYAYYQENANQICLARWREHQILNDQNTWCGFNLIESDMRSLISHAEQLGIYHVDQ